MLLSDALNYYQQSKTGKEKLQSLTTTKLCSSTEGHTAPKLKLLTSLKSIIMPFDPHFRADDSVKNVEENKFIIYPRALNITWGKDKRYWNLPSPYTKNEDCFAELKQVCWLEVTGSTEKDLEPGKKYKVGFVVSLRPDAFGWDACSVYIMAKIGKKGNFSFKKMSLAGLPTNLQKITIPNDDDKLIIEVPGIKEPKSSENDNRKLYFGLYEVWTNRWKGGLRIHHAFVESVKDSTNQNTQSK